MDTSTYTHGYAESVLRSHSVRSVRTCLAYGVDRIRPGSTVLDLGCGPGSITIDIAGRVGTGHVIGVDRDAGVLAHARALAADRGVGNVDFRVMDAYRLDLAERSVDLAHAHQVLQHVGDPVAVLREMVRVTRPGGAIAVRDADYSAFTWYPANPDLDRWLALYTRIARVNGGEPDAGRHLFAWARAAGLRDLEVSSSTWTYSAGPGARWWGGMWADRIVDSAIGTQAVEAGLATRADLDRIGRAWREWSEDPDAWFMVPHGEILATVPDR